MMKVFPSRNGNWDPKQADGNNSRQLALSLPVSICPPPLLGHHPMVTSLLNWSEVIIWPMKDGNGERTFELGPIVTMCSHPWDSNGKNKTHQTPPTRLTHSMYALQANPAAPTPGPSGTLWSKDLSPGEQPKPSQHDEPPIPGPSTSSKPPEEVPTREPEPEVAPTQSTEDPFACPTTPHSVIIIDNTPVRSPVV
ncbi:hypothetical protein O181_046635 [Austropuccinia psidii MF-1]|uniref:Uncharacterized protein n=1 Tax=Austropuccinia psidii MF-1 TaxID=1389203 RepID=A0A9Q3HMD9_9BASI|nr:hypothetical protein [Austropuccinia psidii MF-1]